MEREQRRDRPSNKKYFPPKRKVCRFCERNIRDIDYKKADILRRYSSERGKITPRRVTGTCSYHQRKLGVAIKRARLLALLPYIQD
ncbi:MAG: 30S ribosomal protein S18 [Candidatus Aminicenantes bacterium]|nr:30S ribosomal protein S18 [Candidatus Aminicenantes bacterium]